MVNKLHYLVDITLIVLPFGLPWVFLAVRFSLFCFLSPFGFGCFALPIVFFGVLDNLQILLLSLLVFPLSLFFLFLAQTQIQKTSGNQGIWPVPALTLTPEFRFLARETWGAGPMFIGSG